MKTRVSSLHRRLFIVLSPLVFLALLLAACGGPATPETTATPTTSVTPTTVPMPPTETGCPASGTARRAVMAPLVLGNHPNVVYVQNQGDQAHPIAGMLKRYDITNRHQAVIVTLPQAYIQEAQVSADGQWILFIASEVGETMSSTYTAIQLVRVDGQGLQTLYCTGVSGQIADVQWSPDQRYLAFDEVQGFGLPTVSLLNMATGTSRLAVVPQNHFAYRPHAWLDPTHVYLVGFMPGSDAINQNLYLLDVRTTHMQQMLTTSALCHDFDRSVDGTQLFTSECRFAMPVTEGPSRIQVQPATGGPAKTIYSMPAYAITALRVASNTTLLIAIHNTGVSSVDTSHNGLWKLNTGGTGLTRLTSEAANEVTMLNLYSRYPWSNVSRDGETYAVEVINAANPSSRTSSLLVGPINGGAPITLATATDATGTIAMVGWTTY